MYHRNLSYTKEEKKSHSIYAINREETGSCEEERLPDAFIVEDKTGRHTHDKYRNEYAYNIEDRRNFRGQQDVQ
jgi:hypothetical protein